MDKSERQAIEAAQTLQHVHDIADLLAERMRDLTADEADALLDQEIVRLAILSKHLAAKSQEPGLASSLGYQLRAVIQTRVAAVLKRPVL